MKKRLTQALCLTICVLLLSAAPLLCLSSCGGDGGEKIRIGVLREDDTSGEAKAWEKYLRAMGDELGFSVDFTTTTRSPVMRRPTEWAALRT